MSQERYSAFAMLLHWSMALALLAMFGAGLYMAGLPFSPQRLRLINWHKWGGIALLALALLRLCWRAWRGTPTAPSMGPWQHRAAGLVHALMYVLFFAVPLAGWAYSSAAGVPLAWFGVLNLPALVTEDKAAAELLKSWHAGLAWTLAAAVVLHVAAAAKHQFIDRDGLLQRMLPRAVFSRKAP